MKKSDLRRTWSLHAVVDGWKIGPALQHYCCCYRVGVTKTTSEHITNTVVWFPSTVLLPAASSADAAATTAAPRPHPSTPASIIGGSRVPSINASQKHASLQQCTAGQHILQCHRQRTNHQHG
jgi:hypothetical protein